MPRALAATLLAFALVLGIVLTRYSPPAPRDRDAPLTEFSSARARDVLRAISGSGAPRTIGSRASAEARDYLEGQLASAGWRTEIQHATSCTRHAACGEVSNVVASRPGREPGAGTVLLMAHYDSVLCSPGAGDDGFGTAALVETARAISAGPPLRRTVIVVLTDGEEAGLLGANAFVSEHPLARTVRGAINVDSRGSTGPSAMFETSAGEGWVVGLFASATRRPVTSSAFFEIYRRMPNDTDFTLVKDLGHGVNLANIREIADYHTPLDSFDSADPGTLQHHGDQVLAMARALAESGPALDAPLDASTSAVWFDVLALFIVRWPVSAALGLALTAFVLVLAWSVRLHAWSRTLRSAMGVAAPGLTLVASGLVSVAVGGVLGRGGALPVPWVAHPLAALVALHGATILAGLVAARQLVRASEPRTVWCGTWLFWGALGIVTAVVAPGASFLFVVPTLAAGLVAWARVEVAAAVPAIVAAVLWMPVLVLAYDAIGLVMPALASAPSALLIATLPALVTTPDALPRARLVGLASAAAVIAAGAVAFVVPPYSSRRPQRVNVVFRQDEGARDLGNDGLDADARVFVAAAWGHFRWGEAPAAMKRALGDAAGIRLESPTPWSLPVLAASVPRAALVAPDVTVLDVSPGAGARAGARAEAASRTLHVRLRSPRGAKTLMIVLATTPHVDVVVRGHAASTRDGALVLHGVPTDGIELDLIAAGSAPIDLTLLDVSAGLPPAETAPVAAAVLAARPPQAAPTQDGDVTIVARRARL